MGEVMAMKAEQRGDVLKYCDSHLAKREWFDQQFDFIDDKALAARLALEFYSARYIYKLGEALAVDGERMHAHNKFQIMQYASIYEAIITHLLWGKYAAEEAVLKISTHLAYKPIDDLPANVRIISSPDEKLSLCVHRKEATSSHSIKFDDKVAAAVEIGFVHRQLGSEISEFFRLRNGMHLENAVNRQIQYELKLTRLAYRRIEPFIKGVREFLRTGKKPTLT
jgi:hypothetical protein